MPSGFITTPGCCCSGGGGGGDTPCATASITACVSQPCNAALPGDGVITQVPGVPITITSTATPPVTHAGTTDATGCFVQNGLSPGTYTVAANYGGVARSASVTINSSCDPVGVALAYGSSVLGVQVTGCGNTNAPAGCTTSALPGAFITVTQSGTTVGTGTTDAEGRAYIVLGRPSDGTTFTIRSSRAPYYNDVVITLAGNACTASINMAASVADDYVCCFGPYPFPKTLHATVAGVGAVTLAWVSGSLWRGCALKPVTGFAAFACSGATSTINTAFFVGWTCGTLSVATSVCPGNTAVARLITCADVTTQNSSVSQLQDTASTCDPLFSFGTFPAGRVVGGLNVSGNWTVTE